jgi:immunity protein 26 of polymorphic toxin system
MGRRRPEQGDVFRIPVGDARVAYGQVLSTQEFIHLVVFDGLHDASAEPRVDAAMHAPVVLYAWTNRSFFGKRWSIIDNRPIDRNRLPPIEYVEMAAPEQFQVVDYDGNVLRAATAEDVERAPFRVIVSPEAVDEAVEAWNGVRPWEEEHLTLRPWDERNAERDDEATRLLRRFRGLEEAPEAADPSTAEKIHYFVFNDRRTATAAEPQLRQVGDVGIGADDRGANRCLVAVSTTVAASPSTVELEALAEQLGGDYDGSETELPD